MAPPVERRAFDLEIAMRAADHFEARKKQRDAKLKAIEQGQYTKAESPQRLAKRINRLMDAVMGLVAVSMSEEAVQPLAVEPPLKAREVIQRQAVAPEEVTDAMVERVIGATRDFLAIGFFEKGLIASRAVCRIVTNLGSGLRGLGTGFMVTPALMITNNHVLESEEFARRSFAEFNYQLTESGTPLLIDRFDLAPDAFFLTDPDLDFALVAVEPRSARGTALNTFGFCPLIGAEGKILVRDAVNIVQHPKGELKQIAIRNNTLLDLPAQAPLDKYAHYESDTEQGSSGSPVFNDQWEVIALHHSGVPRRNAKKQILDREGKVWPPDGNPDEIDWISNEAIRVSRLVAFIKAAPVREHEKALQSEFEAISSAYVPAAVRSVDTAPKRVASQRDVSDVSRADVVLSTATPPVADGATADEARTKPEYWLERVEERRLNPGAKPLVLISFASEDQEWVDELHKFLEPRVAGLNDPEGHSYQVWSFSDAKRGTTPGQEFPEIIAEKMWSCRAAIVLLSSDYFQSWYCRRIELPFLMWRWAHQNLPCLPVRLGTLPVEKVRLPPFRLESRMVRLDEIIDERQAPADFAASPYRDYNLKELKEAKLEAQIEKRFDGVGRRVVDALKSRYAARDDG
jgi:hypothetical protein